MNATLTALMGIVGVSYSDRELLWLMFAVDCAMLP